MLKVEKILVPIDFSEESARALRNALALAKETKAELIALHVVERKTTETSCCPPSQCSRALLFPSTSVELLQWMSCCRKDLSTSGISSSESLADTIK